MIAMPNIVDAQALVDWFGYWPDFHDAEILELVLRTGKPSILKLHTWEMLNEITEEGFYAQAKNCIVTFSLIDVIETSLKDFYSHQNVLLELSVEPSTYGWTIAIIPSNGLGGRLVAQEVWVEFEPGQPGLLDAGRNHSPKIGPARPL